MHVVILVARPDRPMDFLQQPIEALYTATILNAGPHTAEVADLRVKTLSECVFSPPDLIFLVTQTYDLTQCYSISLRHCAATVTELRSRFPGTPVIAAGMHPSMRPEMTRRELDCDASLPGELEVAVPWLVERYEQDRSVLNGSLAAAPAVVDPIDLPVPDYALLDLSPYWSEFVDPGTASVFRGLTGLLLANRGCPYSCTYCFVWFGAKIRKREPMQVVAEMSAQLRRGIRDFFFLDYTFTISRPWVDELCAALVEADLGVSWICQTRCERVDPELLRRMRGAGCTGVYYGVESPWIAETSMEKPTPRAVIEQTIEMTAQAGLHPLLFILFGTENNDPAKGEELYRWLKDLPGTFITSALLPRPFTALWDEHTRDRPEPTSWAEYAAIAEHLSANVFSSSRMREIQARIHSLPNYLGNRPRLTVGP